MAEQIAQIAVAVSFVVAGLVWGTLHDPVMLALAVAAIWLGLERGRWPIVIGALAAVFLIRAGISCNNRAALGRVNQTATMLAGFAGVLTCLLAYALGRAIRATYGALAPPRPPDAPPPSVRR